MSVNVLLQEAAKIEGLQEADNNLIIKHLSQNWILFVEKAIYSSLTIDEMLFLCNLTEDYKRLSEDE